jgi:hypothetical protein
VLAGIGYLRYEPTGGGAYKLVNAPARDPDTLALQLAGHKSARK